MDIFVTSGASHICKTERQNLVSPSRQAGLMTIRTRNRGVRPGQYETGVAMFGDVKRGAMEIQNGVAILATVLIRSGGKLVVMRILVAIQACREFHLVNRVLPGRKMAFGALDFDVFSLQGILGRVVFLHTEKRGLPALHGVAFGAFGFFRACFELAFVRVRLVAVGAIGKRQQFLEVAIHMALGTTDRRMLAQKRIFGFRVVKGETLQQLLPSGGGVTVFAALWLKRALVRVHVAVDTLCELHVFVAGRAAGDIGLVAFFASHLNVLTGQRVACLRMVKLFCRFPIGEIVALQAVVAELALMGIFVARHAVLGKPEKRSREILHFDESALLADHVHRRVAFLASNSGVFPFQLVTGHLVIKLFLRRLPVNQIEIFAVVLKVAANAVFAIGIAHLNLEVVAVLGGKAPGDFLVAIHALKGRSVGAELMAARALRRSCQRLVGFGKWPRRDLCVECRGRKKQGKQASRDKSGMTQSIVEVL